MGVREHIEAITLKQIRQFAATNFVPGGSVLAFAGRFEWAKLKATVESLLGDWSGTRPELIPELKQLRGYTHLNAKSTQVHIGIAYDAMPEPDEDSILQQSAAALLSGGMSGRLFTEVREKRGLCYAVYAAYASHKRIGAMLAYAGTTSARAQETLDVMEGELRRLSLGVDESEFRRAIVGMKSRLVMQGESTGARAGAIAGDQVVMGRPRTLEELTERVSAVTFERLNAFLKKNPPGAMTTVTIGPSPLVEKQAGA
jgi:predicted Zn-dependent peptidase